MSTPAQRRRRLNHRRRHRKDRGQHATVEQSLDAHDAHKTDHDYDCNIHERREWGCSAYGICSCGYGDARKMHCDYSELRSLERGAADIDAMFNAVFGKLDDRLAGVLVAIERKPPRIVLDYNPRSDSESRSTS